MARDLFIDPSLIRLVAPCTYEIPVGFVPNMRVPGVFYATQEIADHAIQELSAWLINRNTGLPSVLQIAYVATLPGITTASFAMPDMHSGYGFSIGVVAAFDTSDPECVISPGGVGYDINCGVRLLRTNLSRADVAPHLRPIIDSLYSKIPCGIGGKQKNLITRRDVPVIAKQGAKWALARGYAVPDDIEHCEERGCVAYADISAVSERAMQRAISQMGTLGAGNHYVEVQEVVRVFDEAAAAVLGLSVGQVVVMIHTGSRGFGYQIADDFVKEIEAICDIAHLPDRQLAATPLAGEIGQRYLHAMGAAANFAWCNRQIITHFTRVAFKDVLQRDDLQLDLVYDVAHNIAKLERHVVDGVEREFVVHRKGATRSFGPDRNEIPLKYKEIGQPVLIGGSIGTASYVLLGTEATKNRAFESTCHGAGRVMSRSRAVRDLTADEIHKQLNEKGIELKAANRKTVLEEAPESYKDIDAVVEVCDVVGVSRKVAKLVPLGVIKG
jgi:tRNA-splicing ligase RtcB